MKRIIICLYALLACLVCPAQVAGSITRDGLQLYENGKQLSKEEVLLQIADINGLDFREEYNEAGREIKENGTVWVFSSLVFGGSIATYFIVANHPLQLTHEMSSHDRKCFNACFWTALGSGIISKIAFRRSARNVIIRREILRAWEVNQPRPQASLHIGALSDGSIGLALQF